jgi:Rod binding domain-containing protein
MGDDSKSLLGINSVGGALWSMQKPSMLTSLSNMDGTVKALQATQGQALTSKVDTPEDAKNAGKQFEALLLQHMFASMWESIPSDGLLSGGKEEEMFRDMFNQAIGEEMSKSQSIGIADAIARDINSLNSKKQKK